MVMRESTMISERRGCLLVGLSRTVLHYESKVQPENEQLQARLSADSVALVRWKRMAPCVACGRL